MIIALAGRRIDKSDADVRQFPLQNVGSVSVAMRRLLMKEGVTALVSSAACGADLIGLHEAGKLGLRRRVILPSGPGKFREASVVDRPGDWGGLYDTVLHQVEGSGDLVIELAVGDTDPYRVVTHALLDEAAVLGAEGHETVEALMVWNGKITEETDYTAEFGEEARKRGLTILEIMTV